MQPSRMIGLALGVTLGGLVLGTVLGEAADPKMKNLPEWRGALPQPADADPAYPADGVAYYGLVSYPDRDAPDMSDEAITDWAPDYPAWSYSDFDDFGDEFTDEPPVPLADGRADQPEPEPQPPAAPLDPEPPGDGSLDALY